MAYNMIPDAGTITSLFSYQADDGFLTRNAGKRAGLSAGRLMDSGYVRVRIGCKTYAEHRLIWAMHFGPIPDGMQVDHINGNRRDNRIENLRLATPSQNQQNYSGNNGSVDIPGCHYNKKKNRYVAMIRINGKQKHLGYFDCPIKAGAAYAEAKMRYHQFNPIARSVKAVQP